MNEDDTLLIENCPVCNSDIIIDSCSTYEYPTTKNYIWRFFCRKCGLFRLDIHKEFCSSIDSAIKYYNGLVEQARKIRNAPTVGGWVGVKDRMPEENVPVLVWELQGFAYVDVYKDGVWEVGTPNLAKFTHWMPLPEPPKEVSE